MPYQTKKSVEKIEDKSKDYRILFSILSGYNSHIITIVMIGHLLTEHLLDKIITTKYKNTKAALRKSFSEKLKILYLEWLPLFIYKNIKLLNKARNDIAHNLGTSDHKPIIYIPKGEQEILNIPRRKNKEKFYFKHLINTVLFDLVNHSYHSLKISADTDLNHIFRLNRK
ncbi:hypothetical protein HZC33_00240 [Candidatus Wolfebacteria bacterium]|nr:hypothetical protein [Candidatus Wolfebacteria bacterium]